MCILSVSLEIPSSPPFLPSSVASPSSLSSSVPSSFTSRHRRSLSDTFIFHKLRTLNTTRTSYDLNPSNPLSSSSNDLSPITIPTKRLERTITPHLSPSTPLRNSLPLTVTLNDSIVKYNIADNNYNDIDVDIIEIKRNDIDDKDDSVTSSSSSSSSSSSTSSSTLSLNQSIVIPPPPPLQRPANPQPPTQCAVCFEDAQPNDFIYYMPCLHPFCKDCVKEQLKVQVFMGQKLSCLAPNCKSLMPPTAVSTTLRKNIMIKRRDIYYYYYTGKAFNGQSDI